jgi:hypothetical protein
MSACIFTVSYSCVLLLCVFSFFGFDPQLLTLRCDWFLDVGVSLPYIGFVDGASCSTQNLASATWKIYAPTNELISIHGVFLGRAINNIA